MATKTKKLNIKEFKNLVAKLVKEEVSVFNKGDLSVPGEYDEQPDDELVAELGKLVAKGFTDEDIKKALETLPVSECNTGVKSEGSKVYKPRNTFDDFNYSDTTKKPKSGSIFKSSEQDDEEHGHSDDPDYLKWRDKKDNQADKLKDKKKELKDLKNLKEAVEYKKKIVVLEYRKKLVKSILVNENSFLDKLRGTINPEAMTSDVKSIRKNIDSALSRVNKLAKSFQSNILASTSAINSYHDAIKGALDKMSILTGDQEGMEDLKKEYEGKIIDAAKTFYQNINDEKGRIETFSQQLFKDLGEKGYDKSMVTKKSKPEDEFGDYYQLPQQKLTKFPQKREMNTSKDWLRLAQAERDKTSGKNNQNSEVDSEPVKSFGDKAKELAQGLVPALKENKNKK